MLLPTLTSALVCAAPTVQPQATNNNRAELLTRGAYTDSLGEKHAWRVTANHTLLWDEKPFIPVGGLFQVRSWAPQATDADFADDKAALQRLRDAGITDLYLQPLKAGLTYVKPQNVQRVLDAVDALGFTYGISLADGPRTPLTGYHILPGRYRQEAPTEGGLLRFPVKNLTGGIYCMVDPGTSQLLDDGKADPVTEGARISLPAKEGRNIVFLFPERFYLPGSELGLPNVWDGFDLYRDALLTLFGQVKLGKGFRFFVDALPANLTLGGEARQVVPTGPGFQSEWTAYLSRRYATVASLIEKWGIVDYDAIKDFSDAAQLVPLWYGDKGLPQFYHRGNEKLYGAKSVGSAYWSELERFKAESVRGYMNQLATVLKRGIADAPVVYRSRGYSSLLSSVAMTNSFDGIGVDAYGHSPLQVSFPAAEVYSQIADASRPLWMPVLATQAAAAPDTTTPGFADKPSLFTAFDALRDLGARGFFVDGVRVADPNRKPYDLSVLPQQLAWLTEYGSQPQTLSLATQPEPRGRSVFFPRDYPFLTTRPLTGGSWLLPTETPYVGFDFGPCGKAYAISERDNPVYYLWNPGGPRQIHLRVPKQATLAGAPQIQWLPAASGTRTKDTITLTIGPEPIRLLHYPTQPVPLEAFEEQHTLAMKLLAALRRRQDPYEAQIEVTLMGMKRRHSAENVEATLGLLGELQLQIDRMTDKLRPYVWLEAENVVGYSFDQADERPGASGGRVLTAAARPEGSFPAKASFGISANQETLFRLFVSANPDASFRILLDGQPYGGQNGPLPRPFGTSYALGALTWFDCGAVVMPRGAHTIEVRADSAMTLDAIMFAPNGLTPSGPTPPPVMP